MIQVLYTIRLIYART